MKFDIFFFFCILVASFIFQKKENHNIEKKCQKYNCNISSDITRLQNNNHILKERINLKAGRILDSLTMKADKIQYPTFKNDKIEKLGTLINNWKDTVIQGDTSQIKYFHNN